MARPTPIEPEAQLSGTRYFGLHLLALGAGLIGLWAAHRFGAPRNASTRTDLACAGLIVLSAAFVGRAVQVIVNSAFSDSYRVFRSRHLLGCSTLLAVGAAVAGGPLLTHEPFEELFAHGRITGSSIADLGSMAEVTVCVVAAVVTAVGAWDAHRDERHWYRSLRADNLKPT